MVVSGLIVLSECVSLCSCSVLCFSRCCIVVCGCLCRVVRWCCIVLSWCCGWYLCRIVVVW